MEILLLSFRVPEVIAMPITGGNLKYLEWIKNSTRDWMNYKGQSSQEAFSNKPWSSLLSLNSKSCVRSFYKLCSLIIVLNNVNKWQVNSHFNSLFIDNAPLSYSSRLQTKWCWNSHTYIFCVEKSLKFALVKRRLLKKLWTRLSSAFIRVAHTHFINTS